MNIIYPFNNNNNSNFWWNEAERVWLWYKLILYNQNHQIIQVQTHLAISYIYVYLYILFLLAYERAALRRHHPQGEQPVSVYR